MSKSPPTDFFLQMSPDLMRSTAMRLDFDSIKSLCKAHKKLKAEICDSAIFWREMYLRDIKKYEDVDQAKKLETELSKLINLEKLDYKNIPFSELMPSFRMKIYQQIYAELVKTEDFFYQIFVELTKVLSLKSPEFYSALERELTVYYQEHHKYGKEKSTYLKSFFEKLPTYRGVTKALDTTLDIMLNDYDDEERIVSNVYDTFADKWIYFIQKQTKYADNPVFMTDLKFTSASFQDKYKKKYKLRP